jgi:hypothetical protein
MRRWYKAAVSLRAFDDEQPKDLPPAGNFRSCIHMSQHLAALPHPFRALSARPLGPLTLHDQYDPVCFKAGIRAGLAFEEIPASRLTRLLDQLERFRYDFRSLLSQM